MITPNWSNHPPKTEEILKNLLLFSMLALKAKINPVWNFFIRTLLSSRKTQFHIGCDQMLINGSSIQVKSLVQEKQ